MVLIIILVVVGVVVLASGGFLVASRRRQPSVLESRSDPAVAPGSRTGPAGGVAILEREAAPAPPAALDGGRDGEGNEAGAGTALAERPALRDRLGKARALVGGYLSGIRGRGVDESTFEEIEEALIRADVGITTTTKILDDLRTRIRSGEIEREPEAVLGALRGDLEALFAGDDPTLHRGEDEGPTVWLFVGVNGVGKTTTIGKVAAREVREGAAVVMAAGDTFRAAAGEQLETWATRSGSGIVKGSEGADPSSVIFDAVQHAAARRADLVLADTAGRLHTKVNLMEELKKVRRIAERPPGQLTEVLLVLDATTGQNGLVQARQFTEAVDITGVVLTKLDGTAKGGIVVAIRSELGLPIKLVGLGETIDDLVEFDPHEFVDALFE